MYEEVISQRYYSWLNRLREKVPEDTAEDLLHHILIQLLTTCDDAIADVDSYVMAACYRAYTQPRSSFNREREAWARGVDAEEMQIADEMDVWHEIPLDWFLQMARMPEEARSMAEDVMENGVSIAEIASFTGIKTRTIYNRISMAKKKIKEVAEAATAELAEQPQKTPQQLTLEEFGRFSIENRLTKKSIHPKEVGERIHQLWRAYTGRTDRMSSGCWTCVTHQWVFLMKACEANGIKYE